MPTVNINFPCAGLGLFPHYRHQADEANVVEYLLIAFLIAVVLAPLAWFKSSPGQQRVANFRRRALALGLQAQLVPEIDADESDKRPAAVRYFLPFASSDAREASRRLGSWTLLKNHRRGWDSPWGGWKWFRGEAAPNLFPLIGRAIQKLPDSVYGIRVEASGVAAFIVETGAVESVDKVAESLRVLRQH